MEEFKKINLGNKQTDFVGSRNQNRAVGKKSFRLNNKFYLLGIFLLIVVVFAFFGIFLPASKVYVDAKSTYANAKEIAAAVKLQNISVASDKMAATRASLTLVQNDLNSMSYLGFVPIVNWYYSDASHLVKAGFDGLDAGKVLVNSLVPYADLLGLKGQKGSFVME